MTKSRESFEEFWPSYVRAHKSPMTRRIHFLGTLGALSCLSVAVLTRHKWMALLAPLVAYPPAWLSHAIFEKNTPATFERPLLSLMADLRMFRMMLEGTMDAEVERLTSGAEEHDDATAASSGVTPEPNMITDNTLH